MHHSTLHGTDEADEINYFTPKRGTTRFDVVQPNLSLKMGVKKGLAGLQACQRFHKYATKGFYEAHIVTKLLLLHLGNSNNKSPNQGRIFIQFFLQKNRQPLGVGTSVGSNSVRSSEF